MTDLGDTRRPSRSARRRGDPISWPSYWYYARILSDEGVQPGHARGRADPEQWLVALLADGPFPVSEIKPHAKDHGWPW